jgi:hypothetical protein
MYHYYCRTRLTYSTVDIILLIINAKGRSLVAARRGGGSIGYLCKPHLTSPSKGEENRRISHLLGVKYCL